MRPVVVINNSTDVVLADAKLIGEGPLSCATSVSLSNFCDVSVRQLVKSLPFASCMAVLAFAVRHILSVSPKEQMSRIYAEWVITTRTIVANLFSWRNRPEMEFPRQPAGDQHAAIVPNVAGPQMAIPSRACPEPTLVRFVDLLPKSSSKRSPWDARTARMGTIVPAALFDFALSGEKLFTAMFTRSWNCFSCHITSDSALCGINMA